MIRRAILSLVVALLLSAPLSAQSPPRDTVVIRVPAGVALIVRDSVRVDSVQVVDTVRIVDTVFVTVPPDTIPEPPDTTTPPPPPSGNSFFADFSTCLGTATNCKSDGGRFQVALSSDQYNVGEVVPGAAVGFPSQNALKITPNANQTALRLINNNLGQIPENTSRFYRFYFRLDHPLIGDNNNHPIETNNLLGPLAWAFRSNAISNTEWTAQLRIQGSSTTIWETPPLRQGITYRVEFQLARLTSDQFRLHARIYDGTALLYQDAQWRSIAGGSGNLADNPILSLSLPGLSSLSVGLNGIASAGSVGFPFVYGYQGAFCIRSDTWCGAYVPGEGR